MLTYVAHHTPPAPENRALRTQAPPKRGVGDTAGDCLPEELITRGSLAIPGVKWEGGCRRRRRGDEAVPRRRTAAVPSNWATDPLPAGRTSPRERNRRFRARSEAGWRRRANLARPLVCRRACRIAPAPRKALECNGIPFRGARRRWKQLRRCENISRSKAVF